MILDVVSRFRAFLLCEFEDNFAGYHHQITFDANHKYETLLACDTEDVSSDEYFV